MPTMPPMPDVYSIDMHNRIEHDFTNHAPIDPAIVVQFEELRVPFKQVGHQIVTRCPPCRETSLALTNLEQALMYAVAAIARNQEKVMA